MVQQQDKAFFTHLGIADGRAPRAGQRAEGRRGTFGSRALLSEDESFHGEMRRLGKVSMVVGKG